MNVAIWVVQGLLAGVMLIAGLGKLTQPREKMLERMAWVEDFTKGPLRTIGSLEILAAFGLIVPGITGVAPILVPLAAAGIVATQLGAAVVHARRSEMQNIVVNSVLIALAVFIAWGRLGDYAL